VIEEESGWGGGAFSGVTETIVWTTGPRSGFGLGVARGVVSVVEGNSGSGLSRPGGTAGEAGVGGRTKQVGAGDGSAETQARDGGDRTTGGIGSWGRELTVTDLDAIAVQYPFRFLSRLFTLSMISSSRSLNPVPSMQISES